MSSRVEDFSRHGGVAAGPAARGLRWWAAGSATDEAAVGLLLRAFMGRFADLGCAWVRPCPRPGWYWLDGEVLAAGRPGLGVEERALLRVVAGLAGAPVDLVSCFAGLQPDSLCLVRATLVYAIEGLGGSPGVGVMVPAGQGQRVPRIRPEVHASSFHARWADGAVEQPLPLSDQGAA